MERLNVLYYSSIVNREIKDETDDSVGILRDIYFNKEAGYPRAIGYRVEKHNEIFHYEFKSIEFYEDNSGKVYIEVKGVRDIIPNSYSFKISKDIIGKEVLDAEGKVSFTVYDVRLALLDTGLHIIAVDKSRNAWARASKYTKLINLWDSITGKKTTESLILWDDVKSLHGAKDSDNLLKINVPYKELSTLHPADLADVLEDVEASSRSKVLESMDEELVADVLEEIEEPEVQMRILSSLSDEKAQEILDIIPNDEIAEILEESDDETREKIMANLESDDASEVTELMSYENEEAGSIMAKDFLSFIDSITVREAIDIIKDMTEEYDTEDIYYIFVTDMAGELKGFISMSDLVINPYEALLSDIMNTHTEEINVSDHAETVVDLAIKYELLQIPVVDDERKLVGVINIHDIIDEFLSPLWKKNS